MVVADRRHLALATDPWTLARDFLTQGARGYFNPNNPWPNRKHTTHRTPSLQRILPLPLPPDSLHPLPLPHAPLKPPAQAAGRTVHPTGRVQKMYKCNCTLCHTSAFLYIRPGLALEDLLLLAPLDPFGAMGDYKLHGGKFHEGLPGLT
ncbi:hypothetical protein SODALDRAFT_376201 [Sodiomyces alkalinus F11]|uniref:CENP-V/GFA domain-containing protein n=1 Tax=Sodiomyces alkalinus (strain CBS 110278 / VKM F-3762 / F11) TaxID=1314773 RepID=A0A3N2Q0X0_SODAK|nr:hypothetical protein SODALDRAFT_376201 [Sodiomyces alkalinus F11]ROT40413.1 hypothetical protein SODALDRAFT_376201 [Sodiomyces alkalinus F11]